MLGDFGLLGVWVYARESLEPWRGLAPAAQTRGR